MYEKELIPQVIAMGVSYKDFWSLTPRALNTIMEGYKLQRKVKDEECWILGSYIYGAVSTSLGNAFRKKSQKPKDYFEVVEKPLLSTLGEKVDDNNLTDNDKKTRTEQLFKSLEIMAANHRLTKGDKVS